jgi:hypothetical protein
VPVIAAGNIAVCCAANGTKAAAIIIFFVEVQQLSLGRNTCRCIAGLELGTAATKTTVVEVARAIGGSQAVAIVTGHNMIAISFIIFRESSPTQPFSILELNYFSKA